MLLFHLKTNGSVCNRGLQNIEFESRKETCLYAVHTSTHMFLCRLQFCFLSSPPSSNSAPFNLHIFTANILSSSAPPLMHAPLHGPLPWTPCTSYCMFTIRCRVYMCWQLHQLGLKLIFLSLDFTESFFLPHKPFFHFFSICPNFI